MYIINIIKLINNISKPFSFCASAVSYWAFLERHREDILSEGLWSDAISNYHISIYSTKMDFYIAGPDLFLLYYDEQVLECVQGVKAKPETKAGARCFTHFLQL